MDISRTGIKPTQGRLLPDIAKEADADVHGRLGWVGMRGIEAPVTLATECGEATRVPARVDALVNLNQSHARGIHMSRLYTAVDEALSNRDLTPGLLVELLGQMLDSHRDLSDKAWLRIGFDYLVRRRSLASELSGWRRYPVVAAATAFDGEVRIELGCKVLYSSTCPCSAALARRLVQDKFEETFGASGAVDAKAVHDWLGTTSGIVATPHSQRSEADVDVVVARSTDLFGVLELIDQVENALATPVQTAVKREDEQAFALANGQNLMFCEDAARRLLSALTEDSRYLDFKIRVAHLESLHPHDAAAAVVKGIPGGYRL